MIYYWHRLCNPGMILLKTMNKCQTWHCPLAFLWGIHGVESVVLAGTEIHSSTLLNKNNKVHCLPPCEPFLPPVTRSVLGLQRMNGGWVLGGSALLLPAAEPLELTLRFWALQRDGWVLDHSLATCHLLIDEFTHCIQLHRSDQPGDHHTVLRKPHVRRDKEQTFSRC